MQISFLEIAARRVRLTPAEAVALALAAARGADGDSALGSTRCLPPADRILLSSDGRVSLNGCVDAASPDARVKELAAVVRLLLGLQREPDDEPRPPVPGGLLLLLARALGEIDLPAPAYEVFVDSLERFCPAGTVTLASIYWRCAHRDASPPITTPDPSPTVLRWRGQTPAVERRRSRDRRRHGPTAAELRRNLREVERQLYVALRRADRTPVKPVPTRGSQLTPALIGLAIGLLVALAAGRAGLLDRALDWMGELPAASAVEENSPSSDDRSVAAPTQTPAAAGSSPQNVVGTDVFSPSFSRGGRELLFHAGRDRGALMRASLGESGEVLTIAPLLQDTAANYHATLSPDGEWIAFDSDREGTRAVYVARPDFSELKRVSGEGYAAVPSWSPDGRRLAFVRAEPARSRVWNVWLAHLDTGVLSRVTRHAIGQPWGASWFPDGNRLAYSREATLVIADLRRGTSRVFQSPLAGHLVRTPAVSPDGQRIMFQVYRDGAWLLDTRTGGMRRVLSDRSAEEFAWSPDGRGVAYHARRGGVWSLWHLPMDGNGGRESQAVALLQ